MKSSKKKTRVKKSSLSTKLTVFPAPAGASLASWYSVTVNGLAVPVYDARVDEPHNCAFASFDFSGKIRVTVTSAKKFKKVIVRPLSAGINAKAVGKTITFVLASPKKLCIEFDGDISRPLLIFGNPLETNPPKQGDAGVRYFGPGVHTAGEIKIASNETVYVAGGAVVKGYFTAENASNIAIKGRGVMDAHENSSTMIKMKNCNDVLVEGIIIADQPKSNWTTSFWSCDNLKIVNIKIIAGDNVSNDGIDLVSCQHAVVDNCFVKCFDDAVVLKAIHTNRRDIIDITIKNCLLWNIQAYSVQIGAELDCASVRDILVKNCDCIHAQQVETNNEDAYLYYCGVLGILNGDDAVVSNVRYEDIRVEDATSKLVSIKLMKSEWNHTEGYGEIRDIYYKNVNVVDGKFAPSEILTYGIGSRFAPREQTPKHIPENITFENLTILGKTIINSQEGGFIINPYCKNLRFISPKR